MKVVEIPLTRSRTAMWWQHEWPGEVLCAESLGQLYEIPLGVDRITVKVSESPFRGADKVIARLRLGKWEFPELAIGRFDMLCNAACLIRHFFGDKDRHTLYFAIYYDEECVDDT